MNLSKEINRYRRSIMRWITKEVGSSNKKNSFDIAPELVKRVLISRPNSRLGNMLLLSPLILEVNKLFPNAKIDLFVMGSWIPIIYKNYEMIERDIQLPKKPFKELLKYFWVWITLRKHYYDLAINVDRNSSSGRLSVKFSRAKYKFYGNEIENIETEESLHMAKEPVFALRKIMTKNNFVVNQKEICTLDLRLNSKELAIGGELVKSISEKPEATIAIYTYATGSKCYSENWWSSFYSKLKTSFPNHCIVEVLPFENVSQIQFQAPCYYSRNVREIGAFIANTATFITADCGIMHLASSVNTPTVGLFSVTSIEKYKPFNLGSISFNANETSIDTILKKVENLISSKSPLTPFHKSYPNSVFTFDIQTENDTIAELYSTDLIPMSI